MSTTLTADNRFGEKKFGYTPQTLSHGFFTNVTYAFAWLVAGVGTMIGVLNILFSGVGYSWSSGVSNFDFSIVMMSIAGILGSWVLASAMGILAEISRKLSGWKE